MLTSHMHARAVVMYCSEQCISFSAGGALCGKPLSKVNCKRPRLQRVCLVCIAAAPVLDLGIVQPPLQCLLCVYWPHFAVHCFQGFLHSLHRTQQHLLRLQNPGTKCALTPGEGADDMSSEACIEHVQEQHEEK